MPTRFLINQCQTIIFLILKSDIIENSRIELRGIVLPVLQIKLKLHLLLFYPSTWYICDFFLFHIEIEGKGGWIIGGGGQRVCCPPLSNYWGRWPPLPPPPSSYAYVVTPHWNCLSGDSSDKRSQYMFSLRTKKVIFELSSILSLIWSRAA